MIIKDEAILSALNAFVGLFTQPFEQDLKSSMKAASIAILLATLPGLQFLFNGGHRAAMEFASHSFVLVIVWVLLISIFTKQDKKLVIARNVSVLSFWIAAVLVVILAVNLLLTDPLDRAVRRLIAVSLLLLFIFAHMKLNLPCWSAVKMTLFLWISTSFLAWSTL